LTRSAVFSYTSRPENNFSLNRFFDIKNRKGQLILSTS